MTGAALATPVRGGTVTVLAADDVDSLDPGATYDSFGFMVGDAINRPLYTYAPSDPTTPIPDTAEGPPIVSADGRTITVQIKPGIRYAPPVNRALTSHDVKYAIQRGFSGGVGNGYAATYFGSIVGAPKRPTAAVPLISGITTPDARTLVLRLKAADSARVIAALVLPITAGVPAEYARRLDGKGFSLYGFAPAMDGPYMVKNDPKTGRLTGWRPFRSITLVRNPNWDPATDHRPAYLDTIKVIEGNANATTTASRIVTGAGYLSGDAGPSAAVLKRVAATHPDQLALVPSGGTRYVALNTRIRPFTNIDVRKAVIAGFDRTAMLRTRGGVRAGDVAWGYLPPGIPGFAESGGLTPPAEDDFLQSPSGNLELARAYLRKAGYPGGRYTGRRPLLMVATNADPGRHTAGVARAQFAKLGFKITVRSVPPGELYTRYCGRPRAAVAICPNVGWFKDFNDPESMLRPTFYGPSITTSGNLNWPQLNVPAINSAMDAATLLPPGAARTQAWADINRMIAAQAPAVPWAWDKVALIRSKDVLGVANGYTNSWDLSYSSRPSAVR